MMLRLTYRKRGIAIVMTLLVITLMFMFLSAGLTLNQSSTALAGSLEDQQLATEGAQAGVAYARTRLQESPGWKGGTIDTIKVNMPGQLWVRENNGNVVGIVGAGDSKCAFRIRFNYQDGPAGGDGMNNPPADMQFNNVYVSENNLDNSQVKKVFRADMGSWVVNPTSFSPYDCVRYSATLLCEGLAGDGIRDMSPTNLNPNAGNRRVVRRVAEVVIGRDLSQVGDAPIYGARDINMTVKEAAQVKVRSSDGGVPPRARTLQNIYIQDPTVATPPTVDMSATGEAYVNQSTGVMKVNGVDSTAPVATQEDSSSRFPKITWSQIAKAPPTANNLQAGTYVWRRDRKLHYYAQTYDPLLGPPASSVPDDATFSNGNQIASTGVAMDKNRLSLTFTENVYVAPVGAIKGIAIVPEPGLLAAISNRPNVEMQKPTTSSPSPILTAQGDVFVEGSVRGEGSVTTEGNITFQGTSVMEADQDSRTAIYAKGDVTLEEMPPEIVTAGYTSNPLTGSGAGSGGGNPVIPFLTTLASPPFGPPNFRDIAFSGLFYTQGNIKAHFTGATPADLYFRGMVVAYGGDPDAGQTPGASGQGAIDFTGGNVYLEYDSRYVVSAINLTGPAKLNIASYNLY